MDASACVFLLNHAHAFICGHTLSYFLDGLDEKCTCWPSLMGRLNRAVTWLRTVAQPGLFTFLQVISAALRMAPFSFGIVFCCIFGCMSQNLCFHFGLFHFHLLQVGDEKVSGGDFKNSAEFYTSFIWHHFRDSLNHFHGGFCSFKQSFQISLSSQHSFVDSEPASDYHIMSTNEEASAVSWTPSNWATERTRFWRALSTLRCRMNGTA